MSDDAKALRHDLRTPFNALLNYAEMLLEDGAGPGEGDLTVLLTEARELLAWLTPRLTDDPDRAALRQHIVSRLPALRAPLERLRGVGRFADDFGDDLRKMASAVDALERLATERLTGGRPPPLFTVTPPPPTRSFAAPRIVGSSRILVVDDQESNRDLLCRRLEREGHATASADSGPRALALLAAESFDVVLLDLLMPDVSGYDVLAAMKADARLREVPVIVVSALDELASVVRCIEMGAEDYLPKPFDPVLLRARVNACLEKKRLRDKELEYIRAVRALEAAAAAVEAGAFDAAGLEAVGRREDELGQLARVFRRMAGEVQARERRLVEQMQALRISIDEERKTREVKAITGSSVFEALEKRAEELRRRRGPG